MLFDLPCPDGVNRFILCMDDTPAKDGDMANTPETSAPEQTAEKAPEKPAESEDVPEAEKPADLPAQSDALPIAEKLEILDAAASHEETLRQLDQPVSSDANLLHQKNTKPDVLPIPVISSGELSGTPLVQKPVRVSTPVAKNHTQEVVRTQWSVGKYEPPAANLPGNARLRDVANPVEAACSHLRSAWNAAGNHEQLTDFILSLDGVRSMLERKLCAGSNETMMQRVLRDRLQDLEAERLTALCELDRAHKDLDAYKQELVNGMASRISKETAVLSSARDEAQKQLDHLKQQVNALLQQQDQLTGRIAELQSNALPAAASTLLTDLQMCMPLGGVPLRMIPVSGQHADLEEMIRRVMAAGHDSQVEIDRNTSIVLIVLMAISARIGVSSATPASAATLMENIAKKLGWHQSFAQQYAAEQHPVCGEVPVDATPAVLLTSLPNYAPLSGVTKVCLNKASSFIVRNSAYDVHQWPVMMLPALPFVPEADCECAEPVSKASLTALKEKTCAENQEIDKVLSPVMNAATPLCGAAKREMYRFVSICAGLMDGGLPVAVDWAISLWIVPALERGSKQHGAVKALLDEYPLALSKM